MFEQAPSQDQQDSFVPLQNPNQNTQQPFPFMKLFIAIVVVLAFVLVGLGGYVLGQRNQNQSSGVQNATPNPTPSSAPSSNGQTACTLEAKICPDGTAVGRTGPNCEFEVCPAGESTASSESVDETEGWQTYTDATYTFKYPSGWRVEPGTQGREEYLNGDVVTIISPSKSVSIDILPSQSPYGFGGPMEKREGEVLAIQINGATLTAKEDIRIEGGLTKIFVDLPVPVGENQYHVLFGTGYPVNQDDQASSDDYYKYRDELIGILSTVKIKD